MSAIKPGGAVRVFVGGRNGEGSVCRGECTAVLEVGPTPIHVNFAMWSGEFPESWVEPVTPHCPWTEAGTIVRERSGIAYRLTPDGAWAVLANAERMTWGEISSFELVRLVPDGSEKAARDDTTPVTGIHVLHLIQTDREAFTGSEMFKASCHCGKWSPFVLVTRQEARDAHDIHLALVDEVSS